MAEEPKRVYVRLQEGVYDAALSTDTTPASRRASRNDEFSIRDTNLSTDTTPTTRRTPTESARTEGRTGDGNEQARSR